MDQPRTHSLPPYQQEIFHLLAEGLTNDEIGVRLALARAAVTDHVEDVMERLGLETRLQVAAWAEGSGPMGR